MRRSDGQYACEGNLLVTELPLEQHLYILHIALVLTTESSQVCPLLETVQNPFIVINGDKNVHSGTSLHYFRTSTGGRAGPV